MTEQVTDGFDWGAEPDSTPWKTLARLEKGKVQAIKVLRMMFKLTNQDDSLKRSKDIVDAYQDSLPKPERDNTDVVIRLSDSTTLRISEFRSTAKPLYRIVKETTTTIAGFRSHTEMLQLVADLARNEGH